MRAMGGQDSVKYDIVVVGGGAAGLSGALTLGRARRSVLVVDAGEPRNAPAFGVHGFLSRDGTSPAALLEAGRKNVTEPMAWVVRAAEAGVRAGAAINNDLVAEDTDRAVTAYRARCEARTAGRR